MPYKDRERKRQWEREEIYIKSLIRAFGYRCSVARPEFGSSICDEYECRHWRDNGTRVPLDRANYDLAFWELCPPRRNYLTLGSPGSRYADDECNRDVSTKTRLCWINR